MLINYLWVVDVLFLAGWPQHKLKSALGPCGHVTGHRCCRAVVLEGTFSSHIFFFHLGLFYEEHLKVSLDSKFNTLYYLFFVGF